MGVGREVMKSVTLDSGSFELEANILADVAKNGDRVAQVPIRYRRRPTPVHHDSFRIGLGIGATVIIKRSR